MKVIYCWSSYYVRRFYSTLTVVNIEWGSDQLSTNRTDDIFSPANVLIE